MPQAGTGVVVPVPIAAAEPQQAEPVSSPEQPAEPTDDGASAQIPPIATPSPPAALPLSPALPSEPALPTPPSSLPPVSAATQEDIVVRGRERGYAPDPARALNAQSFAATEAVDKAVIGPVSLAYKKNVPSPFRRGVHNFLYNLREPVVFVNYVLQHKIGKAAETLGRFAINSTVGLAGVLDVAKKKPFKLPRRGNGFADTLGFYGVPPGPFMFLPLVGPTTVRDLFGGAVDRLVLPVALGDRVTKPSFAVPAAVLGVLDHRAEFDETLHTLHDDAADHYANTRDFYLQRRQAEIDGLRGRKNRQSSPMSEAPTAPISLHGTTLTPADAAPAPTPQVPAQ